MNGCKKLKDLWNVLIFVFVQMIELPNGRTKFERGFGVNKEMLILCGQRTIDEAVTTASKEI